MPQDDIIYRYIVDNKFSPAMNKMIVSGAKFNKKINEQRKRLTQLSRSFAKTGYEMANFRTAIGVLGGIQAMKGIINITADFSQEMGNVKSVLVENSGVTEKLNKDMALLARQAKNLGLTTKFTATESAKAQYVLATQGWKTHQIMSLLPNVLNMAAAGDLQIAESAKIAGDIMQQFNIPLEKAPYVMDLLSSASSNSATNIRQFANAMGNAGVMSKMSNVGLEQASIMMMAFANKGVRGAKAGTLFMNMMKDMLKMPPKVSKQIGNLGINIDKFRNASTGQLEDFFGLLDAIRTKTGKGFGKFIATAFNVRSMKGFGLALSTTTDTLDKFSKIQGDVAGRTKLMAELRMKTLRGDITLLSSAFQGLQLEIGQAMEPILIPLIKGLAKFTGWLSTSHPIILNIIAGAITLVTVLTGLAFIIGVNIAMKAGWILLWKVTLGFFQKTKLAAIGLRIQNNLLSLSMKKLAVSTKIAKWAIQGLKVAVGLGALVALEFAIFRIIEVWDELKKSWKEGGFWAVMEVFFGDFWGYLVSIYNYIIKIIDAVSSISFTAPSTSKGVESGRVTAANRAFSTNNVNVAAQLRIKTEKGVTATKEAVSLPSGHQDMDMVGG